VFLQINNYLPNSIKSLFSDSSTLPSNISAAQKLLKSCKNFLKTRKYEEATKTRTDLTDLIQNIIDTTAEDMKSLAIKLRENKPFLESILIFDAASTLSKKSKMLK